MTILDRNRPSKLSKFLHNKKRQETLYNLMEIGFEMTIFNGVLELL